MLNIEPKGSCEVLKFETVTVNFYLNTKTLQMQGPSREEYASKLLYLHKNGSHHKEQNQANTAETVTSTKQKTEAEVTGVKHVQDDRYEEFQAFRKAQREFNNKIERQIALNSIELNQNAIELKDLDQRRKICSKETKLECEKTIEDFRSEIGVEVQKLTKQITSLNSKLSSELKILKNKASSMEDSVTLILHQLDKIKSKVCLSVQSLLERMQETSVTSANLVNNQEPAPHRTEASDPKETRTYAVVASNRYGSLVDENRSLEAGTHVDLEPPIPQNQPETNASSMPIHKHPPAQEVNHQPSNSAGYSGNQEHLHSTNGPVLILGNSIVRGIP